ncbi:MAG TPA: DUF4011 domain-containing protein, partial [Planctomycetota bacterium]|nr:DUF4011 domain-containing protein [Planctomycetota bacterium]
MERQLRLEVLHAARVCYAMQQNAVPLVQLVRLWNDGKELRSVTVELRLEPELAVPWTARLASVPARRTYNLPNVDLQLRPDALANVLERQVVSLRVEARDEHGVLASCEHPVELLAYNEWPGAGTLPALLAAFVLPNHPALAAVLEDSSLRLAAATGGGALDGYQSRDPARALAIAQAIYIALGARGLAYVQPPASFEQQGQKVRTPEQVLADGMGTCLDLALLYAGCLEQVGLHALVVVSEGHAVAGFWSVPESFAGAAVEDPLPLRKRVDLGDIQLVECTGLCAGQTLPFAVAGARGARSVAVDARFLFAIDVAAARAERMRPLPVRTANYAAAVALPPAALPGVAVLAAADTAPARPALPEPVPEPVPAPAPPRAAPKPPPGRLERWQLRLLDLSLRNRLLAFTRGKKSVPLLVTDLLQWAAALGEGRAFQILEAPSAPAFAVPAAGDRGAPPVSAAVVEARAGLLGEELRNGRLRAELPAEELESRLVEIYRHARLGQEESDASTLYLALGFLRWFETPQSSQPRRAPLLLLPLQLQRSSVAEGFRVALTDDEPRVNQTLLQKLQADFGITVKGLDDQPGDDSELDIATVLAAFRRAVVDVDRFEVEAEACIGFFAFTKHLMWLDLHERAGELLQNEFL